ncbi:hypothetical protein FZEAL_7381 [Fusarium zealandicum]|uniref:Ketoreductase domain-containing protein n=1 Tax=Fusarium zealandicum TaxID=1053134 RepID=A0A8H4UFY1_9HYPO|nr:hypothetical protein FZEAL_7381 [Fusarium zealandicum]
MSSLTITPETTVVLVTGANQGIGLEIVKQLATEHPGYHLILSGRRPDAVQEAASSLQAQGLRITTLILDITSDESIAAAAKSIEDTFGRLDVLINNSAIVGYGMDVSPRARMQAVLDTNVIGTALLTEAMLPLLARSQQTRRVVFVSSALGSLTLKADPSSHVHKLDFGFYTHSKAALNMLGLHYAINYEDDPQWKINVVCPGYHCGTNLNGFTGKSPPSEGAISACRAATLGADGKTGTWTDDKGTIPW